MNPLAIGTLALLLASNAGTAWFMYVAGGDACRSKQATIEETVRLAGDAAGKAAADAIARQQPINRTIVQKATHEVQTNTVYRDCVNTAGQLRNINQALTGRADSAGTGSVPGTGAAQ